MTATWMRQGFGTMALMAIVLGTGYMAQAQKPEEKKDGIVTKVIKAAGNAANGAGVVKIVVDGKEVTADGPNVIVVEAQAGEQPKAQASGGVVVGKDGTFNIELSGPGFQWSNAGPQVEKLGDYYIGLQCNELLDDALRAQLDLPKGKGLVVESLVDDSPAAKSGFKVHDILLKANDKELATVADLVAIVDATKEGDLKVEFVRKGKRETLSVHPAKRAAVTGDVIKIVPSDDAAAIKKWIEALPKGGDGPITFRAFAPGIAVTPPRAGTLYALPKDMKVTVTYQGGEAAKIQIKQGDEEWSVTEETLDQLPEKVRGFVGPLVGRWDMANLRGGNVRYFRKPDVKVDEKTVQPQKLEAKPGVVIKNSEAKATETKKPAATSEQKIDEMQRRLKEMQQEMREMQDSLKKKTDTSGRRE